jgi:hypothetical protein
MFSNRGSILFAMGLALAIRLYLCLTSDCISGDGVGYLAMARQFAAGRYQQALGAVFSPLYPLLVSQLHRGVANWELAASLISVIFGTGAVATTYLMTRQAFDRRDLAIGAALLMAIDPAMAAFSASVRTEAGYIFLITAASWLLLKSLTERRASIAALAGAVAGLSYLYRTEGIGLLSLGIFLFLAAALLWKQTSCAWAFSAACIFSAVFIIAAGPYIAYMRVSTGHWTIGREFTAAMMYGMGDVARNGSNWRQLGFSSTASPLRAIFTNPWLYAEKVGTYFFISIYNFVQGLEPVLTPMLAIGIWVRRRAIVVTPQEAYLAAFVLFYFFGFTLSYTGTRFMVHLIPFTFGWVVIGIMVLSQQIAQRCRPNRRPIAHAVVPAAIALTLLPRTLWPIGYDMRGMRYAGEDIAKMTRRPATVVARDGRVAYYAGARLVELPSSPIEDLCGWLSSNQGDYLMIGNRDERTFNVTSSNNCLRFLKRYPRYGSGYYDLYAIRPAGQAADSRTFGAAIGAH